jgi:hypothetical protein
MKALITALALVAFVGASGSSAFAATPSSTATQPGKTKHHSHHTASTTHHTAHKSTSHHHQVAHKSTSHKHVAHSTSHVHKAKAEKQT